MLLQADIERYLTKSKDNNINPTNLIQNSHGFMSWTEYEDCLVALQVYGDGNYWNEVLNDLAKQLGYKKIMMATKRNYKAFEKKFGFKLTGYILEKEVH